MFPIPLYGAFTKYTPSVPDFYRNIYSQEEGLKKILLELDRLAAYANEIAETVNANEDVMRLQRRVARLSEAVSDLLARIEGMEAGYQRNPADGLRESGYVADRVMYDLLRVYGMRWSEVSATGKTWAEIAETGRTYAEMDMLANTILGDGTARIKYTDPDGLDAVTPGY